VVSEHGSPLGLDGRCLGHAYMSVAYILLMLVIYALVVYAWWWSWLHFCHHVMLDVFIMNIGRLCSGYACQCLYVLCMHVCCTYVDYAYIDMVIIVMHEVMLCGRYGHALIMVEMMLMYCYDYVYTCIFIIWLIS